MAKITVVLTAVMHDGKTVRQPGGSVSMDEDRARKLAALGMVRLPKNSEPEKTAPVKAKSGAGKKGGATTSPPPPPPVGDDPDADGDGGKGDV